jgi:hypothetical protein
MRRDRAFAYVMAYAFIIATMVESVQEKDVSSVLLCVGAVVALTYLFLQQE